MRPRAKIEICERCKNFRHSHPNTPVEELPIGYFGCVGHYKIVKTAFSIGPQFCFTAMKSGQESPEWCPMTAELAVLEKE